MLTYEQAKEMNAEPPTNRKPDRPPSRKAPKGDIRGGKYNVEMS